MQQTKCTNPYNILFWRSQFFPLDVAQKIRNATHGIPTIANIINVPIILPPICFLFIISVYIIVSFLFLFFLLIFIASQYKTANQEQ